MRILMCTYIHDEKWGLVPAKVQMHPPSRTLNTVKCHKQIECHPNGPLTFRFMSTSKDDISTI